jgi:hypothetical protein
MPVKHPHPAKEEGPLTHGKGLDTLDRFIIQNWAPPTRFGLWREGFGALRLPKVSMEHFLNDSLKEGWLRDGGGAVITIDPSRDPFVTIRVEFESKHWTPESKYNPKHWLWKIVPVESALADLEAAQRMPLPLEEATYLQGLREGKLKEAYPAANGGAKAPLGAPLG